MANASKETCISAQAVKDCYYDDLIKFATRLVKDSVKAESIVQASLEKIERVTGSFSNMNEIRSSLYIKTLQNCNEYLEYINIRYKKTHEKYYHQLIFFLSYFVSRDIAKRMADKTFEQIKSEYLHYEEEEKLEAFMKVFALKICLSYMETNCIIVAH